MVNLVIADDHAVVREALSTLLQGDSGLKVTGQVPDGEALLSLLEAQRPDIVLLDLEMPRLNGIGVLERLRAMAKTVPVLILSANTSGEWAKKSLQAGANGYVPKNASAQELHFAINSVLRGQTYVSPSVMHSLLSGERQDNPREELKEKLTAREIQILELLADGKKNRDIAQLLHISIRTVDTHRTNILKKLDAKTNSELTKIAVGAGLIKI